MRELSLQNSRLDKRYDILELLGKGSYAEIYVARDDIAPADSPHSKVVVKALNVFMQNDLDSELEKTLVENFQNEAIALDRVRHPNIISRLGHGTARDFKGAVFHYLILEYLPGGDLAQASRKGQVSFEQALDYIEQTASGLAHAHAHGVINRDIKPQNLLLSADRRTVKIADFGVARFSQSESPITRVGTNIYAPPEHSPMSLTDGSPDAYAVLTPAADVYSLAKSAYVLITGESPRQFSNKPITSLPASCAGKPWEATVLAVLNRATQSAPQARYQSVTEFWQDLAETRSMTDDEDMTAVARRSGSVPRAHISRGYDPNVPKQPAFNPGAVPGASHMRPAMGSQPRPQPNIDSVTASPPAHAWPRLPETPGALKPKKKRSNRVVYIAAVLLVFVGVLYITHAALKTTGLLSNFSWFDKTGVVTSDVNLRQAGDANSTRLGLVPRNSRVRIVNSKDNWYEIDVIEYSRPKESPDDPTHGWISSKYVDLDGK